MNETISAPEAPIEAVPSESSALTGLGRAFDIRGLFRSRFRRDLGLTVFTQIGLLGIGALTGLLSARLLGPQGRGELAALTLWPMTLVALTDPGVNSALVFHVGKRRFGLFSVWTASSVLGLLQAACVIVAGAAALPLALRGYPPGVERLAIVFLCFAPVVILGGQPASILQGKLDLAGYNLVRAIAPAAYALGLLALLFLRRPHLGDVVACQLVAFVLATIWGYGLVGSREGFRLAWHGEACKSLLSFGWRTQLSNVAVFFNQRLDQLLLSLFVPPRQLGLYVVSVTVTSVLNIVPQAAGTVT
jgi:O-antigen/teichoic acid export membrane protein